MNSSGPLQKLIRELDSELHDVDSLWQIAIIAVALLAAWWLSRLARKRLDQVGPAWRLGVSGLVRIVFPVVALLIVVPGRAYLRVSHSAYLLDVAVPLLGAWLIVRLALFMLRVLFSGSWLQGFERLIVWVVWTGFALHVLGLAPAVLDFLDDTGFAVGKQHISLLLVLQALLSVAVTLLAAMWLARLIEGRVMQAESVDISLRVMIAKFVRALIVLGAILIVLPAVGIDLTLLSVFGGAVGVGLGLGLQKIASNYVSGFIILLDGSIRIGDIISVDNRQGRLVKMTARYVVVRSLDGTEAVIPNDTIITSTVLNNTYSDRRVVVPVPVQVAYHTDLRQAMELMREAAMAHDGVLRDPAPGVAVKALGENGIDLELGAWMEQPEQGPGKLRSELLFDIWQRFRQHGIEVPYPQREVRIVSGETPPARPPA